MTWAKERVEALSGPTCTWKYAKLSGTAPEMGRPLRSIKVRCCSQSLATLRMELCGRWRWVGWQMESGGERVRQGGGTQVEVSSGQLHIGSRKKGRAVGRVVFLWGASETLWS